MATIKTAQRCRCSCRRVPVVVIVVYWIIIWLDLSLSWWRRRRRQPCPLNSFRRLRWRRIRWRTALRPIFRRITLVNKRSQCPQFLSLIKLFVNVLLIAPLTRGRTRQRSQKCDQSQNCQWHGALLCRMFWHELFTRRSDLSWVWVMPNAAYSSTRKMRFPQVCNGYVFCQKYSN